MGTFKEGPIHLHSKWGNGRVFYNLANHPFHEKSLEKGTLFVKLPLQMGMGFILSAAEPD